MGDITSSLKINGSYFPIVVLSLGAIVTTTVTFSIVHIMLVKYCNRRRDAQSARFGEQSTPIGLEKSVINTIPILFYSSKTCDLYRISQGDECVICLGQLCKGDLIRCLPNCSHAFHVTCIDNWFHEHINCPICRALVKRRPTSTSQNVGTRVETSDPGGRRGGNSDSGITRTRSGGKLCHSTKMVLPIEGLGPRELIKVGLKRSLSTDQICVVVDTKEYAYSSHCRGILTRSGGILPY